MEESIFSCSKTKRNRVLDTGFRPMPCGLSELQLTEVGADLEEKDSSTLDGWSGLECTGCKAFSSPPVIVRVPLDQTPKPQLLWRRLPGFAHPKPHRSDAETVPDAVCKKSRDALLPLPKCTYDRFTSSPRFSTDITVCRNWRVHAQIYANPRF